MFEVMPAFVLKCEVVGGGDVPSEEDEVHCEPSNQKRGEEIAQITKEL